MLSWFREYREKKLIKKVSSWLRPEVLRDAHCDRTFHSILLSIIEPFFYHRYTSRGACWYMVNCDRGCGSCIIKSWLKGSDGSKYCQREVFTKYNPKSCPHIKKAKQLS